MSTVESIAVLVQRAEPGRLDVSLARYANGQLCEDQPMTLQVGQAWGQGTEHTRVPGVSRVTIGGCAWDCSRSR